MSKSTISTAPDLCEIKTTLPSVLAAETLAAFLLDQRLVACCHILPSITAVYSWNNTRHADTEVPLIVKTRLSLAPAVMQAIIDSHPYDVPEVLCHSVTFASASYTSWVAESTSDSPMPSML
ncbi:MAG: divalent-cation tolerance protein CutA [Candidatus Kapabacteria bacterium]|jgi:periplasmic divalent cation tolerance protein|nr:divalent-cation tolerance protein CutA [Candidatus Kapabacteria bacterium]